MKVIQTGQEARDSLKRGIDIACNCAKVTLGQAGRNAVLGRIDIPPTITNDGVSVVRNVEVEDEIENQGVWMVKEACSFASRKAKDGTTTTAVLIQSIINDLFEMLKDDGSLVAKKVNVMALMKEVDKAKDEIIEALEARSRNLMPEEIYNVALVAGEFEWLAKIVADIYSKIGKDGYVTIKEGNKTSYETFNGIEFDSGYPSEYFINNDEQQCVIKSPAILVTNQSLDASCVQDIIPKLVELESKGLILIAPEFSRDLLNRLNTTKLKTEFSAVCLKLPTFDKDDILKDIATLTKAKFLDKNTYTKISDFIADIKLDSLGTSDEVVISADSTLIIGGKGDTSERVKLIKEKMEETTSMFDKDRLEKRLAYLSGGVATLTIGGDSDFEKGYFKLKAENAVNSVQNALMEGVVEGGGKALLLVSEELPTNVLSNAIKAPYKQIQTNSGGCEIGDNVIDPVLNTMSSLRSAVSIAGRVLTTEVVIAFKNESKDENKN